MSRSRAWLRGVCGKPLLPSAATRLVAANPARRHTLHAAFLAERWTRSRDLRDTLTQCVHRRSDGGARVENDEPPQEAADDPDSWASVIQKHLAERQAQEDAERRARTAERQADPVVAVARRLKNNLDHFVDVLEDPDREPSERAAAEQFVLNIAAADWNAAPAELTKLKCLFRSFTLARIMIGPFLTLNPIRTFRAWRADSRGVLLPAGPIPAYWRHLLNPRRRRPWFTRRTYRALADHDRAERAERAAVWATQDLALLLPGDAQVVDLPSLARALFVAEDDRKDLPAAKRGGRYADGGLGRDAAIAASIRLTSFPYSKEDVKKHYGNWQTSRQNALGSGKK